MLAFSTISELVAEAKALHEVDGEGWHKIWYQYMGFHLMLLLFMVTWGFVWLLVLFSVGPCKKPSTSLISHLPILTRTFIHVNSFVRSILVWMMNHFRGMIVILAFYEINYWCWNCVSEEHWVRICTSKVWL